MVLTLRPSAPPSAPLIAQVQPFDQGVHDVARQAEDYLDTPVAELPDGLPPLFGACRSRGTYLESIGPGADEDAYLALYSAYELTGTWHPETIQRLLLLPFPLVLCLDFVRYSP